MWIKICGIRDVATAQMVGAAGADAVGLNFFSRSPRSVSRDAARQIVPALPAGLEPVGLFVNHPLAEVQATANLIQSRRYHTCTALQDGSVLVAGGLRVEGGSYKVLGTIEVFTPAPL